MCANSLHRLLTRQGSEGVGGGSGLGSSSSVGGGYIAQKYIERPLLIHARKFDIRQWVTVLSWAPLNVWMYSQAYARFCSWPFSLATAASNRYAHLSNNSVQKHSAAFEASGIEGNMWGCGELAAWLEGAKRAGQWAEGIDAELARRYRAAWEAREALAPAYRASLAKRTPPIDISVDEFTPEERAWFDADAAVRGALDDLRRGYP